jgi:hypothetical protein
MTECSFQIHSGKVIPISEDFLNFIDQNKIMLNKERLHEIIMRKANHIKHLEIHLDCDADDGKWIETWGKYLTYINDPEYKFVKENPLCVQRWDTHFIFE